MRIVLGPIEREWLNRLDTQGPGAEKPEGISFSEVDLMEEWGLVRYRYRRYEITELGRQAVTGKVVTL